MPTAQLAAAVCMCSDSVGGLTGSQYRCPVVGYDDAAAAAVARRAAPLLVANPIHAHS